MAVALVGFAAVTVLGGDDSTAPPGTVAASVAVAPPTSPAVTIPSIDAPGSIWWLVTPNRPIPDGYEPTDLVTPDVPVQEGADAYRLRQVTAEAFEAMAAEATAAGFQLQVNSGYRSFEQQRTLYDQYVEDYGPETAAQLVAVPGTSEHQTGLAVDVGLVGLADDQVFGDTAASAWVAANAHRFGLIVRYPPDKAAITGYANEPWHLRYVGPELAAQLHQNGATMEEHFGLVPAGT